MIRKPRRTRVRLTAGLASLADGTVEVEVAGPAGSAVPADGGMRPFRARRPHGTGSGPGGEQSSGPISGDCLLMVRPTGIRIVGTHNGEHHLAGTVADVAFRGRGYEHAIDVDGYGRLTGVLADARAARGETVGLRLDPSGCHVFARGPGVVGAAEDKAGAVAGDAAR